MNSFSFLSKSKLQENKIIKKNIINILSANICRFFTFKTLINYGVFISSFYN